MGCALGEASECAEQPSQSEPRACAPAREDKPTRKAGTPNGALSAWGDPFARQPEDSLAASAVPIAAMRAMMTDYQLAQLTRTHTIVERLQWFLGHYLAGDDPERTSLALSTLCPTDRDTLAGTIKVLVEAQERLIKLTRLVTGVGPETGQPGKPPTPETPALPVMDLSSETLKRMPVEHLAALQRVIEMVDGTTIKRELPMPPPPIRH